MPERRIDHKGPWPIAMTAHLAHPPTPSAEWHAPDHMADASSRDLAAGRPQSTQSVSASEAKILVNKKIRKYWFADRHRRAWPASLRLKSIATGTWPFRLDSVIRRTLAFMSVFARERKITARFIGATQSVVAGPPAS
jgi:hypothetical protein